MSEPLDDVDEALHGEALPCKREEAGSNPAVDSREAAHARDVRLRTQRHYHYIICDDLVSETSSDIEKVERAVRRMKELETVPLDDHKEDASDEAPTG